MNLAVKESERKLEQDRSTFEAERELFSNEKQEKVTLQFELKDQMRAMEELTIEIEKKEKWIRNETDRLERLAAKIARKEKTLNQEKQRVTNFETELNTIQDEVVKQQEFITIERDRIDKERQKLENARSLSSMYIPDMKKIMQQKRSQYNSTTSAHSSSTKDYSKRD